MVLKKQMLYFQILQDFFEPGVPPELDLSLDRSSNGDVGEGVEVSINSPGDDEPNRWLASGSWRLFHENFGDGQSCNTMFLQPG